MTYKDEALKDAYSRVHAGRDGVTVTFNYPDGPRTVVATSRIAAFDLARGRWGDGWRGEPCVSTPWTIYLDVIGAAKMRHGQDLDGGRRSVARERHRRLWREGK